MFSWRGRDLPGGLWSPIPLVVRGCRWSCSIHFDVLALDEHRIARIELQWISRPTSLAFGDTTTRWPLRLPTGSTHWWGTERHRSLQMNWLGDSHGEPIPAGRFAGNRLQGTALRKHFGVDAFEKAHGGCPRNAPETPPVRHAPYLFLNISELQKFCKKR